MLRIELTEKESRTLAEILESSLAELKTERVATEQREWRAEMKEREAFITELLQRLSAGAP